MAIEQRKVKRKGKERKRKRNALQCKQESRAKLSGALPPQMKKRSVGYQRRSKEKKILMVGWYVCIEYESLMSSTK